MGGKSLFNLGISALERAVEIKFPWKAQFWSVCGGRSTATGAGIAASHGACWQQVSCDSEVGTEAMHSDVSCGLHCNSVSLEINFFPEIL